MTTSDAQDQKDEHPVEPAKLAAIIKQANKIVVTASPMENAKVLFTSTAPKDIADFDEALSVVPPKEWFHCMCIGTPAVRIYRDDIELALVTNHHGHSVRCSLWTSDALLSDTEKWLQWFDARNIKEPRREVDESAARARQHEISYARWLAAMPKCLHPIWEEATRDAMTTNVELLHAALSKEFPETRQRVLALFHWFGSGDGPWSGYPSYEGAAEELLLEIPTPELVGAAQTDNLTDTQLEGAARLFGGWHFSQSRRRDRETLPAALKKKLLDHSLETKTRTSSDEQRMLSSNDDLAAFQRQTLRSPFIIQNFPATSDRPAICNTSASSSAPIGKKPVTNWVSSRPSWI